MEVETDTEYLKIAKKGGGHKDLLTTVSHAPTPEPAKYDKTEFGSSLFEAHLSRSESK